MKKRVYLRIKKYYLKNNFSLQCNKMKISKKYIYYVFYYYLRSIILNLFLFKGKSFWRCFPWGFFEKFFCKFSKFTKKNLTVINDQVHERAYEKYFVHGLTETKYKPPCAILNSFFCSFREKDSFLSLTLHSFILCFF